MAYTTINKSTDYFNTKLYTGNGATATAGTSARSITGVGFQPDLTWVKARTNGGTAYMNHSLHDVLRGASKSIESNETAAEADVVTGYSSGGIGAFTSDGFDIYSGTTTSSNNYNGNNSTYVAWNWKANGAGSSNTDGSITSTVSVNTTAGFSIVSYTGTGSGATVGHGLGVAPKVIIFKNRDIVQNWVTYHEPLGFNTFLKLNTTDASATNSGFMNNSAPTSSVFGVNSFTNNNGSGNNHVAYCFAEVPGYSKFGSYTGNGNADGTFVYTGFKPAFVIIKNTNSSGEEWGIWDNKRDVSNVMTRRLVANVNAAENTADYLDFTSNGFKIRTTAGGLNGNGNTLIYMAFGQSLVGSNNVPCTAR